MLSVVDLLDTPQHIPFWWQIQRAIIYRNSPPPPPFRGREGAVLGRLATLGDQSHRTAKAMRGSGELREAAYE